MKLNGAHKFFLNSLNIGASLTLGLLSFGGMFALVPSLPLAISAFFLAVLFDGEIYKRNILGALIKLLSHDHIKQHIAKQFLDEHIFKDSLHKQANSPQFFKDYHIIQEQLHALSHQKKLTEEDEERRDRLQRQLDTMRLWFARLLFNEVAEGNNEASSYQDDVIRYLRRDFATETANLNNTLIKRQRLRIGTGIFSILGGIFMGLGTLFLLTEPLTTIPFLMALPFLTSPFILIPLATIVATAYALLTFNALCDFFENETYLKWAREIKKGFAKETRDGKTILIAISAIFLIGLALFLTICTAGTWFTIAQKVQPIFSWLAELPTVVMSIINPIITGLSAVAFNIQNTTTTLDLIKKEVDAEEPIGNYIKRKINERIQNLKENENIFQWFNPFRIILKFTLVPLEILLFLGHLISLAVTADRLPGISEILCVIFNIISEGFEDTHYFLPEREGSHHDHDHNHDDNIPSWVLKRIFIPVFFLTALWHAVGSYFSSTKSTSFEQAFLDSWQNFWEGAHDHDHDHAHAEDKPSTEWQREYALITLELFEQEHLQSAWGAEEKTAQFHDMRTALKSSQNFIEDISKAKDAPLYNKQRFFGCGNTKTTEFLTALHTEIR